MKKGSILTFYTALTGFLFIIMGAIFSLFEYFDIFKIIVKGV